DGFFFFDFFFLLIARHFCSSLLFVFELAGDCV
ncbi:MAG: hypothetical protein ACI87E_002180, partial [Mariniblastus sp.]